MNNVMMAVELDANAFRNAVSKLPRMKRGPTGARGHIPKDTIIGPAIRGKLVIDTPATSELMVAEGIWRGRVSLDARILADVVGKFLHPRNLKSGPDIIKLSVEMDRLAIRHIGKCEIPCRVIG